MATPHDRMPRGGAPTPTSSADPGDLPAPRRTGTTPLRTMVALGDSQSVGIGGTGPGGRRHGWVHLLADALRVSHPGLALLNLARTGATIEDVRHQQLPSARAARPDLVTVLMGVNDAMSLHFDEPRVRQDTAAVVEGCVEGGATVLLLRLHDPAGVLPLPGPVRAAMRRRVHVVNQAIDDAVTQATGALVLDLAADPTAQRRDLYSLDRLHLNPRGHLALAAAAAGTLSAAGVPVDLTAVDTPRRLAHDVRHAWWLARQVPLLGLRGALLAGRAVHGRLLAARSHS